MAKRTGSTTILKYDIEHLFHEEILPDVLAALRDWQGDGSITEGSYLQVVEQVDYYVDDEGNIEVEWEATIREPKAD